MKTAIRMLGLLCLLCTSFSLQGVAQSAWLRFTIQSGGVGYTDYPVSVDLEGELTKAADVGRLVELVGDERLPVPFQIVSTPMGERIHWLLAGAFAPGTQRIYELERGVPAVALEHEATLEPEELVLRSDLGQTLLSYHHAVYPAPVGSDSLYARSGFIHPLNTPAGHTLTNIQPADHIHHYGLWNPWTRVQYGEQTYDLWNLHLNQGTVRFTGFDAVYGGPVTAGFVARQAHVVFAEGAEVQVMDEQWAIQVFPQGDRQYTCDLHSLLTPVGEHDIRLQEYRYGGLVFRLRDDWTPATSEIILSSGKTRDEADGSPERWTLIRGSLGEGEGGLLIMASPINPNYPEPIRLWPSDANDGKGDIMFNFSPIKNGEWLLPLGQQGELRYRLVVFDGELSEQEAENLWMGFAYPPTVTVEILDEG